MFILAAAVRLLLTGEGHSIERVRRAIAFLKAYFLLFCQHQWSAPRPLLSITSQRLRCVQLKLENRRATPFDREVPGREGENTTSTKEPDNRGCTTDSSIIRRKRGKAKE
jgi:hypothetical protein